MTSTQTTKQISRRLQFRGCLLGLAAGDALGYPTEFISSMAGLRSSYGPKGIQDLDPGRRGHFTDDTQMTVAVARAFLRTRPCTVADLGSFMGALSQEFVAWSRHPENNRAPGSTCMSGCAALSHGASWKKSGVKTSKGCGAAMRAAPVGLYFSHKRTERVLFAAAQGSCTHAHPTGIASSVAAASAVAFVVRRRTLDGIVDGIRRDLELCTPELMVSVGADPVLAAKVGTSEMLALLAKVEEHIAKGSDPEDVCSILGGAWVGDEAVATALWCVLKEKGDYLAAVRRGANSTGDSDSIACIAGSIAGALQGERAIPSHWRLMLEKSNALAIMAETLEASKRAGAAIHPEAVKALDFYGTTRKADPTPDRAVNGGRFA